MGLQTAARGHIYELCVCVCVCACVCACMCVCVCIYTYIYIHQKLHNNLGGWCTAYWDFYKCAPQTSAQ